MDISDRKKKILKSVIDAYIATGEPVGSKLLSGSMAISSATIRNEMSELEQLGYLEQLHSSSGRIPSSKGYRFYVDSLMSRYKLTLDEIRVIDSLMKNKLREFRDIIDEATRLLSGLTKYTAVSLTAKQNSDTVKRFEGILINETSFFLVMITSHDEVKTHVIKTAGIITSEDVVRVTNMLNTHLAGRELSAVTLDLIMRMENEIDTHREIVSDVLRAVYSAISESNQYTLNVDGASKLLEYPEFSDIAKARELLGTLEEKDTLINKLLGADMDAMNIFIGEEGDPLDSASLIVRTFTAGDSLVGAVGIIGPKRMDYSSVVARLEYLSGLFLTDGSDGTGEKREGESPPKDPGGGGNAESGGA